MRTKLAHVATQHLAKILREREEVILSMIQPGSLEELLASVASGSVLPVEEGAAFARASWSDDWILVAV